MVLGSGLLQRSSQIAARGTEAPRISIVIPNYNGGASLERAIRSVLDQEYPNLQLILADGDSTDDSQDVVGRYADSFCHIVCRKDGGQADALNYAFRMADGDIFGWLCSDDELLPGSLDHVSAMLADEPEIDIVAGASERVFEGHFRNYVPVPANAWEQMGAQNVFDQPGVFWRASLHRRVGELDTSFNLGFDWDFWCRMRDAGARLRVTDRAIARYNFSGRNKSSVAGQRHVEEGFRIIRQYGPLDGRLAHIFRLLYRHFDLKGALDSPPACSKPRLRVYKIFHALLQRYPGPRWMDLYNWHFASLQQRNLEWWDYKRIPLEDLKARLPVADAERLPSDWTGGTNLTGSDQSLTTTIDGVNVVLNRKRLADFSRDFAADCDLRDFLLLDAISTYAGLGLTSSSLADSTGLAARPSRLWEYVWLFKGIKARRGGLRILDLSGGLSHLPFLSAMAGNDVVAVESDPRVVEAGRRAAAVLGLPKLRIVQGDPRDLGELKGVFDIALACSVLEHQTASDQSLIIGELSRLLAAGGRVGMTFDYGPAAPNASIYMPGPHDPPKNAAEVRARLVRAGLGILGNQDLEDPVPGTLFSAGNAPYAIASLFLGKGECPPMGDVRPESDPTLLGAGSTPDLAATAQAAASNTALRREREEAEKQTWVNQFNSLNQRIAVLTDAAQERLVYLERSHGEAERLRAEVTNIRSEADKRLAVIEELTAAVQDRESLRAEAELVRNEAEKRLDLINALTAAVAERDEELSRLRPPPA